MSYSYLNVIIYFYTMLKKLLIFMLLPLWVSAQRQSGGISFTPQFNYKISGGDTTYQFGNTLINHYPYFLTKWQSDQRYAPITGGLYLLKSDSTGAQGYVKRWYLTNQLELKANLAGGNDFTGFQSISNGAYGLKLGYSNGLGSGGIWDYNVTPSDANFALTTGTAYTQINSPTVGGNIFFTFGGSNGAQMTTNGFSMLGYLEATNYPAGNAGADQLLVKGSTGGIFGSPIKSIPANSYVLKSDSASYTTRAQIRIPVTAGASNPVTVTYSSYASTYGINPKVSFYELVSAGVYRLRSDVPPKFNVTGTTINSIEFDFGYVPDGYILITH